MEGPGQSSACYLADYNYFVSGFVVAFPACLVGRYSVGYCTVVGLVVVAAADLEMIVVPGNSAVQTGHLQ